MAQNVKGMEKDADHECKKTEKTTLNGGLYPPPPGILPGIRLQSRNSTGLIMEFDIPAESARNIMGIVFVLLCLVIPYRV